MSAARLINRIGAKIRSARLRPGRAWLGVLAILIGLAIAGSVLRRVSAQSEEQAPSATAQPDQDVGESSDPAPANPPSSVPAAASAVQPAPASAASPEEQRKREVANECTSLLKMATDLKAEIDKTTKDELSIAVVRKAGEIEQFAHKVRGDTRFSAGKD